ncbi:MAG TPA: T9SS type A sorting domain-containing protein [Rubricoccaceae bacterium]
MRSPNVVQYTPAGVAAEPGPAGVLALVVSPNPARGAAVATVSHPAGPVTVDVLDALGPRVALVAEGDAAAGARTLALPVGGLAPGAYVVRLTAGRDSRSRPFVVVR